MRSRLAILETGHGRSLAEEARKDGYDVVSAFDVVELERIVQKDSFPVLLIAFEALQPDPQRLLRNLKQKSSGRIIVVFSETTPRLQLAQRLWSVGAFDYLFSRGQEPEGLTATLKQAFADAKLASPEPSHDELGALKLLHMVSAALGNHKRVDSLLRELQRRLPYLIKFEILQILIFVADKPQLFVFQRTPLPHEEVWSLAAEVVGRYSSTRDVDLKLDRVEFKISDPTLSKNDNIPPLSRAEVVPMMFCGEAIGFIGLKTAQSDVMSVRDSLLLQLLAHQLAISLVHAESLERAQEASMIDPLTGLHNRRYLDSILHDEWERCNRYHLQLSVLLLDIDRFKQINDLYGHLVGDVAIRRVADTIRSLVRASDAVIRMGGEEFLILLPETHASGAAILFERIRVALKTSPVEVSENIAPIDVMVSGGLASFPMNLVSSPSILIRLADDALLTAKRNGRDRLFVADGFQISEAGGPVQSGDNDERRRYPRIGCSLTATFLPIREFDREQTIALSTINLSATGLAVRDPSSRIERNSLGMLFLDDRRTPHLAKVHWVKSRDNERTAGIELVRSSEFLTMSRSKQKTSKALVVASRPLTLQMAMRCLRSNRFEVDAMKAEDPLPQDFSIDPYTLIILAESAITHPLGAQILQSRKSSENNVQLLIVGEESDREKTMELISSKEVEHLISDRVRPEQSLFATLNKIVRGEYFGVRRYLLQGANTKRWSVSCSSEKQDALAGIGQVAEDVGCHPRIQDLLMSAVDEMLLNALMHANKESLAPVTVECGADGHVLAVSVMDDQGRLEVEDIYRGLKTARERAVHGLPAGLDSAGLGFRIMLDSLSHVVVNVEPNLRTEVIGIVDLGKSLREYRSVAPSLGVFQNRY